MHIDLRRLASPAGTELFLTARFAPGEARRVSGAIEEALRAHGAWVFQERAFAPTRALESTPGLRQDGVEPSWLVTPADEEGSCALLVHAVGGAAAPRSIAVDGVPRGRELAIEGRRWISASALAAPGLAEPAAQATAAFESARTLLAQAGAGFANVARTWIFMDRILDWYGEFNAARTGFFRKHGVIGPLAAEGALPASTGIGLSPERGRCMLDFQAVIGPADSLTRHHAAGNQASAFDYGSAFARASRMASPAGANVFVSGTAAIDASGASCHRADAAGQIAMALENVDAVLQQMGCAQEDVVSAVAYCRSEEVRRLFGRRWSPGLRWPTVSVIADVCRPELLFEVEVTAWPGASKV